MGKGDEAVDNRVKALGRRLRALRNERSLTLSEVAQGVGVSTGLLSQVETGVCSPSVKTLLAISSYLKVDMAELFVELPDSGPVVRAEQRVHHSRAPGVEAAVLASDEEGRWELAELIIRPGGRSGRTPSRHRGREAGILISGRAVLELAGEPHELEPGDSVVFPSTTPHQVFAEGREPVRLIWLSYGSR